MEDIRQQLKVGEYILSNRICNEEPQTFSKNNVGFNYQNHGPDRHRVDQESVLFELNKKLSRYPPNFQMNKESDMNVHIKSVPSASIINIGKGTRVQKSCEEYKPYTPFIPLPNNIQGLDHVIFKEPERGGINSRNLI